MHDNSITLRQAAAFANAVFRPMPVPRSVARTLGVLFLFVSPTSPRAVVQVDHQALAQRRQLSVRTIQRHLGQLRQAGLVETWKLQDKFHFQLEPCAFRGVDWWGVSAVPVDVLSPSTTIEILAGPDTPGRQVALGAVLDELAP